MGRFVLSFEQFVFEASEAEKDALDLIDDTDMGSEYDKGGKFNSQIHQILLRNREKIKDDANIDDYLFNKIVDDMSTGTPLSLDEDDIVDDAIKIAYMLKAEAEPYMKLDQGEKLGDMYDASRNGKSGVAVQNYDNQGSGDSLG